MALAHPIGACLDRRLQHFDLPGTELMTHYPKCNTIDKTLTLDAYICWRISDVEHVDQFIRTVGTPEGAQAILGQRLNSELGAAVGKRNSMTLSAWRPPTMARASALMKRQRVARTANAGDEKRQ